MLALGAVSLPAQEPAPLVKAAEAITPEAIAHHIGVIAHDSMRGRETPTNHVDPTRRAAIEHFVGRTTANPETPGTCPWVIATGQTYLADFADPEHAPLDDPQAREFVRLTGIRSVFVVPLRARGQAIGAMAVMQTDSGRRLTPDDCALLGELAQRVALALDNVRLLSNLRAALRDASVANRAKDDFLAVLGHELRNPLAPIVTSLELMARRGDLGGPERWIIERQVRHLMRLVDDLLDISRITSGKVMLRREVVDLRQVVGRALELTQPALEGRRAPTLDVDDDAGPFLVDGDPTRLTQVVCNLLINATKYSDPDRPITIGLGRAADSVRLTVQDEGIGIAPEVLPTIFDRFTQGEQAAPRSQGGLGLGLAIARNLVELHGGSIHASSAGRGQGSLFVVQLPSPASLVPDDAGAPPTSTTSASARVLVVDDNVDAADALAEMLALEGHEVRTASSGASALECLEGFHADVALLDIGLPDISGHELAASIRRDPRWRSMRLIALTGYGRGPDVERALAAGFDAHLTKPADIELILHTIAQTG
jgi:signal transduction histidine kinase/CheY-like chemotaxis protein